MRRNYDRRHNEGEERYDRVYVDWPQLWGVRQLTARPLKTIYINRSAARCAEDRIFTSVTAMENYCDKWGIELP